MTTRLAQFVRSALIQQFQHIRVHLWSDSRIVLHWIYKYNIAKPFIANSITEIVDLFPPSTWSFTPSNDNPADLTREISTEQLLLSQMWSQGPKWLSPGQDVYLLMSYTCNSQTAKIQMIDLQNRRVMKVC